ncbi:MAG: T9SS type A sorting domain-containing protein [Flavobacteriia bacterium]|nr:T9SS type A sorting domain-containing protein [Flavobacteriia bacterium]
MKQVYTLLSFVVLTLVGTYSYAQCTVTYTENINGLDVSLAIVGTGTAAVPGYGVDWGDGNIGVGQNPTHTYGAAGTYTVCAYFFDLADTSSCNAQFCQDLTVTNSSASIKEIAEPLTVSVYPNPAVNSIEISSTEPLESFYIYNTLGTMVYSDRVQTTSAKVNISDLPKGVYLLRCNGLTKRFVKK